MKREQLVIMSTYSFFYIKFIFLYFYIIYANVNNIFPRTELLGDEKSPQQSCRTHDNYFQKTPFPATLNVTELFPVKRQGSMNNLRVPLCCENKMGLEAK